MVLVAKHAEVHIDDPNVNAQKDLLAKYGLTVEDIMEGFNLYNACKKIEQKSK